MVLKKASKLSQEKKKKLYNLLDQGKGATEIAELLDIARSTVYDHKEKWQLERQQNQEPLAAGQRLTLLQLEGTMSEIHGNLSLLLKNIMSSRKYKTHEKVRMNTHIAEAVVMLYKVIERSQAHQGGEEIDIVAELNTIFNKVLSDEQKVKVHGLLADIEKAKAQAANPD